jgi:hypothetical protein
MFVIDGGVTVDEDLVAGIFEKQRKQVYGRCTHLQY